MSFVEETVVVADAPTSSTRSYVDWPAIIAGAVLATAISLVLLTFGSAIGLSMTSAQEGQSSSLLTIAIVGGVWLLLVQVFAAFAGGYITGRMRQRHGDASEQESDFRDGTHGLIVWALATLLAAVLAYSGAMGTARTAGSAAGAAASAVGSTVGQAADTLGSNDLLVDRIIRAAPGAAPLDPGTRDEVGRIMLSAATSEEGLSEADRQYLVAVAAERAGVTPEEAQQRIEQVMTQAQALEQQVRDAADQARRMAVIAGFLAAAALVISAATAYFASTLGGNHRDNHTLTPRWHKAW